MLGTPIGLPQFTADRLQTRTQGGTAFLGGHTTRELFAVSVADITAKREPAHEPHTPHCSSQFVS